MMVLEVEAALYGQVYTHYTILQTIFQLRVSFCMLLDHIFGHPRTDKLVHSTCEP
jgi:hypothetical protein